MDGMAAILSQINQQGANMLSAYQVKGQERQSEMTRQLMQKKIAQEDQKFNIEQAQKEADNLLKVMTQEDPIVAHTLAGVYGLKGANWTGPIKEFSSDGQRFSGSKAVMMNFLEMSRQGKVEEATQYFLQNGGMITPDQQPENIPKTFEAASLMAAGPNPSQDQIMDLASRFQSMKAKSGTSLRVNPDGTIEFSSGGQGLPSIMPTSAVNTELQKDFVKSTDAISRVDGIVKSFKPEYLKIPDRLGFKWDELKEKWGSGGLDPERAKDLEEYSVFRQNAIENINQAIKDLTGASMSVQEAQRIRTGLPDPGDGVFDGDPPSVFKPKLVNSLKKLKAGQARKYLMLQQGLSPRDVDKSILSNTAISIDDTEKLMEQKFEEYRKQFPKKDIGSIVNMVQKDFGLVK